MPMVFSSLVFLLLFLPLFLLLYFVCAKPAWRNAVLLLFSLLFYAWGEPKWIVCMIGATLINYGCALWMTRPMRPLFKKLILAVGVVASLLALVYFKYASFLLTTVSSILRQDWSIPAVALPIGISFYTFQILTYTVDVYRGKAAVQKNPFLLLLYVSCFPQLIAGPIVQYADIEAQLANRSVRMADFSDGMGRFAVGLGKKVLLANLCGKMVEELLAGGGQLSVAGAWLSAAMYMLQIYFDFSAYSDMAIGLGRVMGFTYKENFNYPYISGSVSEFWRRWHISLGSFFREYVYIPLGGNRAGMAKTIRNLLIVWCLTGFWHGASWNFLLWGLYYGAWIVAERFLYPKLLDRTPKAVRVACTLLIVLVGWILFYHTDLSLAGAHIGALIGIGATGLIDANVVTVLQTYTVFPLLAAVCCLPVIPRVKAALERTPLGARALPVAAVLLQTVVLALSVIFLVGQSYNPFIYFRF